MFVCVYYVYLNDMVYTDSHFGVACKLENEMPNAHVLWQVCIYVLNYACTYVHQSKLSCILLYVFCYIKPTVYNFL